MSSGFVYKKLYVWWNKYIHSAKTILSFSTISTVLYINKNFSKLCKPSKESGIRWSRSKHLLLGMPHPSHYIVLDRRYHAEQTYNRDFNEVTNLVYWDAHCCAAVEFSLAYRDHSIIYYKYASCNMIVTFCKFIVLVIIYYKTHPIG